MPTLHRPVRRQDWPVMKVERPAIGGEMRHVGGDVEHLAGLDDDVAFQPLAEPGLGFAGHHVDRGLVVLMLVGAGATAGRDGQQDHAEPGCANRLCRDALDEGEALLALIGAAGADHPAGPFDGRAHLASISSAWGEYGEGLAA